MDTCRVCTNGVYCSSACESYTERATYNYCDLFGSTLRNSPTNVRPYRCDTCIEKINAESSYQVYLDENGVTEIKYEGFLKEPVRDPAKNMRLADLCDGIGAERWEKSTEDMYRGYDVGYDNVMPFVMTTLIGGMLVITGICAKEPIFIVLGVVCTGAGIWVNIILPYLIHRKKWLPTKQSQPILDNLTQAEATLCAKISKLPNKNKLITQCKEYAQTLMNSKTDQSIEPLLTKLYNICTEQLNVGLKENVREIECFISAMEEVESRSLNNEEN